MSDVDRKWTKPYHGVQHLGELGDLYKCSIDDSGTFAILCKWYPGCGFCPIEEQHPTAAEARAAGEKWLEEMYGRRVVARA